MGKVFYKLYYHGVWSTYLRDPLITTEIEKYLYPFLINKAKRFDCEIFKCNGMEDHVHIAISIPPANAISDIIGKLKGSSTYFLNKELQVTKNFSWQGSYGVLSFAERDMKRILKYIEMQKEHHKNGTINKKMEDFGEE